LHQSVLQNDLETDAILIETGTMEFLSMIGFYEDVITDEVGRGEAYLVLKRNDPGLLWLAKSSLEVSMA